MLIAYGDSVYLFFSRAAPATAFIPARCPPYSLLVPETTVVLFFCVNQ